MEIKLKKGDIVTNTIEVRSNPVVCESRGWAPIGRGAVGVGQSLPGTGQVRARRTTATPRHPHEPGR